MKMSVIVCVYNCSKEDLKNTIVSAINQNIDNYEIIISDDCSKESYELFVESLMKNYQFNNYTYIRNETNIGTVKNILGAVEIAKGFYIKPIGAGDLFANKYVLKNIYEFMRSNNYQLAFGNMIAYKSIKNNYYLTNFKNPFITKCYINKDIEKMKRYLTVYADHISGASLFYSKEYMNKYMNIFKDKIIYVEDFAPRLALLDGHIIGYLHQDVIVYQLGSGISTNNKKSSEDRIKKDREAFNEIISNYPDNSFVRRYKRLIECERTSNSIFVEWIKKIIHEPLIFPYQLVATYYRKTSAKKDIRIDDFLSKYVEYK